MVDQRCGNPGENAVMSAVVLFIATASAARSCSPFNASLNNTHCDGMVRIHEAEASVAACRAWCCASSDCNAYTWHVDGNQCRTSSSAIDPSTCRHMNQPPTGPKWIGETRGVSPPPPPQPPAVTRKRGYSGYLGDHYTCDDAKALDLQESWWYNWIVHPSQYNKCKPPYSKMGAEFVPMINGIKALPPAGNYAVEWAASNAHYLLGYNEPDPGNHPHACSPMDGAKAWPQVQEIAAKASLRLVSPSVSSEGFDDDGRSAWLDEFFGNCSDQRVAPGCDPSLIAHIGFHDYHGNASLLMRKRTAEVEGPAAAARRRYKRSVWITEFAVLGKPWAGVPAATRAQQDAFMREALPLLDASDDVFRYAWFTSRNKPNEMNAGSNLLPWDSDSVVPTSTGRLYANASL